MVKKDIIRGEIENFIFHWTSDDIERSNMIEVLNTYMDDEYEGDE